MYLQIKFISAREHSVLPSEIPVGLKNFLYPSQENVLKTNLMWSSVFPTRDLVVEDQLDVEFCLPNP